ncbi:MAG: DNA-methyltransferase [Prosthecobacter sp.]|uniref:DNA-methyltransferase n=1 Tax=Prosthecobacter sp. TaxID=1965333 RepID=UPI0038FFFF0D
MPVKRKPQQQIEFDIIEDQGVFCELSQESEHPQPFYEGKNGSLFLGDAIHWLKGIPSASVDLIFADPPYNIKKADWDTFDSMHAYVAWSRDWLTEASRVLKPSGTIYVCGFSEILADVKVAASHLFEGCRWLVWHYKNKANLGKDWGRSHESILHFRKSRQFTLNMDAVRIPYGAHTLKYPEHPQAETSQYGKGQDPKDRDHWTPNPLGAKAKDVIEIPTTCNGMGEKTAHPTQKPEELLRRLVLASSNPGDLVLDPFSGSGTTIVVAEQLGRRWLGCDSSAEYNGFAAGRLERIVRRSDADWAELDRKTALRRESIR